MEGGWGGWDETGGGGRRRRERKFGTEDENGRERNAGGLRILYIDR